MNRKNYFLVLLALFLCACSKHSSEPQVETSEAQIVLDWSQKSEGDVASTGMTLLFYPNDGGAVIEQNMDLESPFIRLPEGAYRVIAVSNDSKTAALRNQSVYETAEVFLNVPVTRAELFPTIDRPLYAAVTGSSLSVKGGGVKNACTLLLKSIVKKIQFEVLMELNKPLQGCSGTLTGISSAVNLSTLEPLRENPSNVSFDFLTSTNEMRGEAIVFGVNPDIEGVEKVPNQLQLKFRFTDGTETTTLVDVSQAMNEALKDKISISIKVQTDQNEDGKPTNVGINVKGEVIKWKVGEDANVSVGH